MTPAAPREPGATDSVLLVGNPNVGKTTLFNALTGESARVGNYPGVTVDRRAGNWRLGNRTVELVDAPGSYSLSARSAEEQVAIEAALGLEGNPHPSVVVAVVDATHLARNLYLALQLVEFRIPIVLALTMLDEVDGAPPVPERVGEIFGLPCVAINPRRRTGLEQLRDEVSKALDQRSAGDAAVSYSADVVRSADRVADALPAPWKQNVEHDRSLALWALLSVDDGDELSVDPVLRARCAEVREDSNNSDIDLDLEVISARYRFIDARLDGCYSEAPQLEPRLDWTERIDRVLLHPLYGLCVFFLVMLGVFQALFSWTDPAIGWIEGGVGFLQEAAANSLPAGFLTDLLTEGVLGGVGNVIVFLPQILLLFFLIGLLEDSGYMARVAYLMDRVLRGVGLHGKAFVPMLSGLACAVPAILATRTMERRRDRILTMMVVPLMSCSARLPVYALLVGALFPPSSAFGLVPVQGLLMVSMYVFSTAMTLAAAWVLGRTVVRGQRVPLILELPPYRLPSGTTTLRMMLRRAREFLTEAGTVILAFTIVLWALLTFPQAPVSTDTTALAPVTAETTDGQGARPTIAGDTAIEASDNSSTDESSVVAAAKPSPEGESRSPIEQSYAGRLGKSLEPLMRPLGFDWKITVGIIGAFSAREVFISTMAMVFGLQETDDEAIPLRDKMRAETRADGQPAYPPLVGLSLMVFFALACQCMSTVAVVKRETRTWRWPALLVVYMTALAYVASLLVYQGGRLLGFAG